MLCQSPSTLTVRTSPLTSSYDLHVAGGNVLCFQGLQLKISGEKVGAHVQPMTEEVYSPSVPEMGTWLLRLGRKAGAWPSDISMNWAP